MRKYSPIMSGKRHKFIDPAHPIHGKVVQRNGPRVGDAEAAKSSVPAFVRKPEPAFFADPAIFSGRRPQLTRKPAERVRSHRVARYNRRFDAAAFLALECTVVETGRSRFELREQHAILLALRAAGPLDRGYLRRGYRLKFGHDASLSFGALPDPPGPMLPGGPTAESNNGLSGMLCGGQKCSHLKTYRRR